MDRPARNKKSVDYSQFLDLENDDEDFASSVPVSKKSRIEPKREKKDKASKKPKDETLLPKEETSTPKNSQSKRLPLDDKIYQRDLEVALALSVQETSVIIENDESIPRNVSPAFFPSESKDPEVSFSNCSVDSNILGLDEITENKEQVNGRNRRQAASKAITEQRKLLKDDSSGEEDADEFRPDSAVYDDSDSDESYSGDDDDEEFEVKKSKKAGTSQFPKAKKEKKVKNTPKARRKDENDSSVSEDEEFDIKKSKKSAGSKSPKAKSGKKENNVPLSKTDSVSSPAPVSIKIKIKPIAAKPTTASSPDSTKPNGHGNRPVGMKRPAWSPPASSGSVGSPVTGLTVRSPNQGLRLGLSRLARVKPLHPAVVPH